MSARVVVFFLGAAIGAVIAAITTYRETKRRQAQDLRPGPDGPPPDFPDLDAKLKDIDARETELRRRQTPQDDPAKKASDPTCDVCESMEAKFGLSCGHCRLCPKCVSDLKRCPKCLGPVEWPVDCVE
ncbi:unnamed protein product [Notodromas monacha]|uniref:RING-type domain-containing protein n=1 Tax=Notodromas monacha TaxID=399045 RepID=A0A7R9BPB4_9CRUS|nr:unnamed protein product [Notodromas monacha]CAG0917808.1 unnamed protein product [Notodromas monacha]